MYVHDDHPIFYSRNADGKLTCKFGALIRDDRCSNIFEAIVGTLRSGLFSLHVNIYVRVRVRVSILIYTYVWVCVFVCICVYL